MLFRSALEEGISFVENVNPEEAVVDANNHVQAMRFSAPGRTVELPARSVMVAAGTTPNITYEKEHAGSFQMDSKKKFFQPHAAVGQIPHVARHLVLLRDLPGGEAEPDPLHVAAERDDRVVDLCHEAATYARRPRVQPPISGGRVPDF